MSTFKADDRVKWTSADGEVGPFPGTFLGTAPDAPHAAHVEMDDDPGVRYCLMLNELTLVEGSR